MIILIDNGHGIEATYKSSPDYRLIEYAYAREIAQMLMERLKAAGYDARRIVTETKDIPLSTRYRRVNNICDKYGEQNCVLVSIHTNAAVGKGWQGARGFSVFVSLKNASAKSKELAKMFTEQAIDQQLMGNRSIPASKYWEKDLGMCRETHCPAVLTENLFHNNREDVDFLLSPAGKEAIVTLHFEAITRYVKKYGV